ncbi:MAG: TonB-dependent receptor [Gammaproteobacteria bacterium]|nr:TonB-dependent receptor [Gammaproteobacteria bacterium]
MSVRSCTHGFLITVLATPAVVVSNLSFASELALEEIIVTATRRESALMETSASISAFDGSLFDALGIEGSRDLVARTPSLSIGTFRVAIRGIGRPNLAVGSEPGVGIYWDGVYNTENGVFNYARFMDIERIEVLRGPQGTLYGRNSIGGAISFISKRPTEELSGRVTAELSNYNGRLLQGYVSGSVDEEFGVFAGISKYEREGFQDNTFNGRDYDKDDTLYGTLGFQYQPSERWTNNLKLIGVDRGYRQGNGYILEPFKRDLLQSVNDVDTGEILGFPGMFPKQNFVNMRQGLEVENPALLDEDKVRQDRDPELRNDRYAAFFTSEYGADTFSLKYTFGYSKYWFDTLSDADASVAADSGVDWSQLLWLGVPVSEQVEGLADNPITPADMTYQVDQEAQFSSHEIQYTSNWDSDFSLLGGLYYYHSDEQQVVSFMEFNDDLIDVYRYFATFIDAPVSDDNFLYRGEASVDSRSYAVYGQLGWDWTERTALSFGLRYSYDEKKGNDNTFVQFVGDPDNPTVFREEEDDWDEVTWRVGVDHSLNNDHFVYGFIATGYRSGGFNFQKPTDSPDVDVVKPESIISYEVGYKGSWWDNRVNVSSSMYYYDYQDLQVLQRDVVNGIGLNTFVNADEAAAWGFELEARALVSNSVLLSGTYSWNDSQYDELLNKDANACTLGPLAEGRSLDPLCTEDIDLQGNQFPSMPEHKVSANVTYMWELFDLDWSATASYFYTHDSYSEPFNNPELDKIESYDSWDARLTAVTQDQKWQVTAFVRNIEDDREVVNIGRPSTVTQNAQSTLLDPRMTGISVDYTF